jgi:hypothetical protein
MLKEQRVVVTLIAGVVALVELYPATAQSQTLLETAVFLFTQKKIKETSPGAVQTYHGDGFPLQEGGSADATWSVKDKNNCIIRFDYSTPDFKAWKEFYLDNILPSYESGYEGVSAPPDDEHSNGVYFIKLISKNAVYCEGLAAGKAVCRHQWLLKTQSKETLEGLKRTLGYIYTKFCAFAKGKQPF